MSKYLSKSRFKVAYECPAKLFYNEQPSIYANKNCDNEFLKALAHGGFQVGALAKFHYPNGTDLEGLKTEDAIAKTNELLKQQNVIIFEAAIQTGPFLVRADILKKETNKVSLIEVKSSSHDFSEHVGFFKKRDPGIDSDWESYLVDVAYQTWVAKTAHPEWDISPFLMLADKSSFATVDGLHQYFQINTSDKRSCNVIVKPGLDAKTMGQPILKEAAVHKEVEYLLTKEIFPNGEHLAEYATYLAEHHQNNKKAQPRINSLCKGCEFRVAQKELEGNQKSGFQECWTEAKKLKDTDANRTLIFDIWNCRKTEDLLAHNKVFFDQITIDDLKPKSKSKKERRLPPYQRQWIQIEKTLKGDKTPHIDIDGLTELFSEVVYPLHCIDFETTMVAIPFHKGRHPYEQLAFQFSHHILHKDGRIEHVDQHLDFRPGVFPNFDFVRKLKKSLEGDNGTIFRYATHENTVLRQIREQLMESNEKDKMDLVAFIEHITQPRGGEDGEAGDRNMLDLREIVLEHYYHPLMGGSNSIKKVIPAVLEESEFLKKKYCSDIYGKNKEIKSLNFDSMTWIQLDETGKVIDPYKRLPPVFSDISQTIFEGDSPMFQDETIDDGGAAMTAWSRMQFMEMKLEERDAIRSALFKYCELDTLSMIWLLEYWTSILKGAKNKA